MRACPSCGAPAAGAACPYCGAATSGGAELSEKATAASCPRCEGRPSLRQVTLDGVGVDACTQCSGLWLETGELERLTSRELSRARVGSGPGGTKPVRREVSYLPCPACGTLMNRTNHGGRSGIIIDTCPGHGAWLDGGELEAIRAHVAAGSAGSAGSAGGPGGSTPPPVPPAASGGRPLAGRSSGSFAGGESRGRGGDFLDDLFDLFGGGFDPF